jgi:hypothetical protein
MNNDMTRHNRPVSHDLHPWIYLATIGLAFWFVAAAWGFFDYSYTGLALAVVSGFFLMAVALPSIIWREWRKYRRSEEDRREASAPLREWLGSNFPIWQGQMKGSEAAIMVLLPFVAVAFGMTAFAIVLHVVEHNI